MSTLAEQQTQPIQVSQSGGVNNPPSSGNSMTQISAGPAALAQIMIQEIMHMYAKIIEMEAKQKATMSKVQADTAISQGKATAAAGKAAGEALIVAGAMMIGFAGLSAAGALAFNMKNQGELNAQSKAVDEEMNGLNPVEKQMTLDPNRGIGGRGAVPGGGMSDEAIKLKAEFKRTDFSGVKGAKPEDVESAVKSIQNDEDYQTIRQDIIEKRRTLVTQKNNILQGKTNAAMLGATFNDVTDGAGKAGSSFAQGIGQTKQAAHNAEATVSGATSQMAGSQAGESGQSMVKAADAQNQEVQILERINQSNSINA